MRTQLYVKPLINYDVLVSVEFGRLDVYHSLYTYMYIYFRRRVPAGRAGLELGTQDLIPRLRISRAGWGDLQQLRLAGVG